MPKFTVEALVPFRCTFQAVDAEHAIRIAEESDWEGWEELDPQEYAVVMPDTETAPQANPRPVLTIVKKD